MSETFPTTPDHPLTPQEVAEQHVAYDSYYDRSGETLDANEAVRNIQDRATDPAYYQTVTQQISAEASTPGVDAAGNTVTHENEPLRMALDEPIPVWRVPEAETGPPVDGRKAVLYAAEEVASGAKMAKEDQERATARLREAIRQDPEAIDAIEIVRSARYKSLYGESAKAPGSEKQAADARAHVANMAQQVAAREDIVWTGDSGVPKPTKPKFGGLLRSTRQAYQQQVAAHKRGPKDFRFDLAVAQISANRAQLKADELNGYATEDLHRYYDLEEIRLNAIRTIDPIMLEARFGMLESLRAAADEPLMQWFQGGYRASDQEQSVFTALHDVHKYVDGVDATLKGMPENHPWYAALMNRRAELSEIYNRSRYRKEFLRLRDNITENSTDFSNRIGAKFHPDAGIELEDGSGVVLYPDGSYKKRESDGNEQRYAANGELWKPLSEATFTAVPTQEALSNESLAELRHQQKNTLNNWFKNPSDVAAAEEARSYIDALTTQLEAQSIESTNAAQKTAIAKEINGFQYWMAYLQVEPGAEASAVTVASDGAVYSYQDLHGEEGIWKIWPSGHAYLVDVTHPHPDGSFDYRRRVGPDGQDL